jgi:hypothetical protein
MYYLREELNFRATILLDFIQEKGNTGEIQALQEIIKANNSNTNPIQQMEVVDRIYEKYKFVNTTASV